jgi:lycopene cyclase CruA
MKIHYQAYIELPAPRAQVVELLGDPTVWPDLPGDWEALGTLWQHGGDLYRVDRLADDADGTLRWEAAPVTGHGPRATLAITLYDATIATHLDVSIGVDSPGIAWPWRQWQISSALRKRVAACQAALAAELHRRPVPASVSALAIAGVADDEDDGPLLAARGATPAQAALIEKLQERYPQTVEHFLTMGAIDHLERVSRLEAGWGRIMRDAYDPEVYEVVEDFAEPEGRGNGSFEKGQPRSQATHFDLIYAGGGLGLLHAAVMAARYGRRVMVFDRSEVGCAHREWNISRAELAALVESGVVSWDELGAVVMREYRDGLVRFHSRPNGTVPPTDLWLPEVLNVALDAGALLRLMRRKLEDAGGTVLSGRIFRRLRVRDSAPMSVEVELVGPGDATERYRARLLLDGMGSTSPLALLRHAGRPFAGVCPTVGTVAKGFAQGNGPQEYDPTLGDILVSVADSQGGEQMMWEGFPGRGDELTIYLFYYSAIRRSSARDYSMLDLFEQYFSLLPTYKRPGPGFHHVKPVYGYIPARHSLRPQEAPLLRGVLPVGDSAAQQSPLTFCGFGSHVRNLRRTTGLLDYALRHDLLDSNHLAPINAFQANVSLNWIFSRFMEPWDQADDVNRLQNLFIRVLHEMGVEKATRFFQDRMRWADYHPMLLGMMWHYPGILLAAWKVLGIEGITQWMGDYARFSWTAATAAAARVAGRHAEQALTDIAERLAPALGLRLRARYAEWRSMGWL